MVLIWSFVLDMHALVGLLCHVLWKYPLDTTASSTKTQKLDVKRLGNGQTQNNFSFNGVPRFARRFNALPCPPPFAIAHEV